MDYALVDHRLIHRQSALIGPKTEEGEKPVTKPTTINNYLLFACCCGILIAVGLAATFSILNYVDNHPVVATQIQSFLMNLSNPNPPPHRTRIGNKQLLPNITSGFNLCLPPQILSSQVDPAQIYLDLVIQFNLDNCLKTKQVLKSLVFFLEHYLSVNSPIRGDSPGKYGASYKILTEAPVTKFVSGSPTYLSSSPNCSCQGSNHTVKVTVRFNISNVTFTKPLISKTMFPEYRLTVNIQSIQFQSFGLVPPDNMCVPQHCNQHCPCLNSQSDCINGECILHVEPSPVMETPSPVMETPSPVMETPSPVVQEPSPTMAMILTMWSLAPMDVVLTCPTPILCHEPPTATDVSCYFVWCGIPFDALVLGMGTNQLVINEVNSNDLHLVNTISIKTIHMLLSILSSGQAVTLGNPQSLIPPPHSLNVTLPEELPPFFMDNGSIFRPTSLGYWSLLAKLNRYIQDPQKVILLSPYSVESLITLADCLLGSSSYPLSNADIAQALICDTCYNVYSLATDLDCTTLVRNNYETIYNDVNTMLKSMQ